MESIQQALTSERGYLSPEHRKMLTEESGISEEVIRSRGYWTATDPDELKELGFAKSQRRAPALVLPVRGVEGEIRFYRIRPDDPRPNPKKPEKVYKYEQPFETPLALDIPLLAREGLSDRLRRLWIVEGEKKADALISQGEVAVALLGVWAWKRDDLLLPEWDYIPTIGREILIAFDSDVADNYQIRLARQNLAETLSRRGGRA